MRLRPASPDKDGRKTRNTPVYYLNHQLLSLGQERELFKNIRKGNKRVAAKAMETLIAANQRMVYKFARRYLWSGIPIEDLIQQGNIGLLEAAKRYDSEKGFKFDTYAQNWVWSCIGKYLRKEGIDMKKGLIPGSYLPIEKAPIVLLSGGGESGEVEKISAGQKRKAIREAMGELRYKDREVLRWRFFFDKNLRETGEEMGFSYERARQLEARGLSELREILEEQQFN